MIKTSEQEKEERYGFANIKTLEPWKEEIYGFANHYYHLPKSSRFAPLEGIISILRAFEKNIELSPVELIKYESEINKGGFAYDIGFPLYRGMSTLEGGHKKILASIIGKHPIKINELPFGDLRRGRINEDFKIDFKSMDIKSMPEFLKESLKGYDFPEIVKNAKIRPTQYEISAFLEENKDKKVTSDDLISLFKN